MTERQAISLVAQIASETNQVEATITRSRPNQDGTGYVVRLTLKPGQRVLTAYRFDEWESIKMAWSHWLPDLPVHLPREKPVKYLVDGLPMIFYVLSVRGHDYWVGRYQHAGQDHKRYFGKIDPRPLYPVYEEKKEEIHA